MPIDFVMHRFIQMVQQTHYHLSQKEAVVKMCCITTDEAEYSRETKQQLCWNVFQIHRSAANSS